jgi:hypothetical protein
MWHLRYLFLSLLILTGSCVKEEEEAVYIPDTAFFEALLEAGVDENGDGRITVAEAGKVRALYIGPRGISDLQGLEAFTGLDTLSITVNPLVELDLGMVPQLRMLNCEYCELFSLDISLNTALEEVRCGRNHLDNLDVSGNTGLRILTCNNNRLDRLDLRQNKALQTMISCGNRLNSLDLSQNTQLTKIGIDNMPLLEEVCVWTLPFPPEGVTVLMEYSPGVVFTRDCLP